MARLLWLVTLTAACGRFDFDPVCVGEPRCTAGDGAQLIDAPAGCTATSPWSTPIELTALDSPFNETGPTLSPDGRELYFASDHTGSTTIYVSHRTTASDAFGPPVPVAASSGGLPGSSPTLSGDGLTLYFALSGGLVAATRASTSADFGAAASVPSPAGLLSDPALSIDGRELFYAGFSFMATPALLRATGSSGAWGAGSHLSELEAGTAQGGPFVTADGSALYFESDRGGAGTDIYVATRPAIGATFSTPTVVNELSSSNNDVDPALSLDGALAVFASNRPGTGGFDLYLATRTCQ